MEARTMRLAALATALWFATTPLLAAGYRTTNFTVNAPTLQLAQEIGQAAEQYRKELAISWLGKEMPPWSRRCPITAQVSPQLGAGGATSFYFDRGEVFGWKMNIQGSHERILDSVLPHEVTHTIFASHFRQPLPRWADEGACTTVEHESERAKQDTLLIRFLTTQRGIPFSRMFAMKDYPSDVMPLYSQGYSVARYLIQQGGRRKFLDFVADGLRDENWPRAVRKFYGRDSLLALQNQWVDWVRRGSPQLDPSDGQAPQATLVAQTAGQQGGRSSSGDTIYRAQSADPPDTAVVQSSEIAAESPDTGQLTQPAAADTTQSVPAKLIGSSSESTPAPVRPASTTRSVYQRAVRGQQVQQSAAANTDDQPATVSQSEPMLVGAGAAAPEVGPRSSMRQRDVVLEWNRPLSEPVYEATGGGGTVRR